MLVAIDRNPEVQRRVGGFHLLSPPPSRLPFCVWTVTQALGHGGPFPSLTCKSHFTPGHDLQPPESEQHRHVPAWEMASGFRKCSLFLLLLRLPLSSQISPPTHILPGPQEVESLIPDCDALGVGKPRHAGPLMSESTFSWGVGREGAQQNKPKLEGLLSRGGERGTWHCP